MGAPQFGFGAGGYGLLPYGGPWPAGLSVAIDSGAGEVDYTQYIEEQSIEIDDQINQPTLTSFSLVATKDAFSLPPRNAYIRIYSNKYQQYLATGFISSTPEPQFLGLNQALPSRKFQMFSYRVKVTSDEYLLNSKTLPFIPAFVNQTMGQILARLAEALAPGFFDVTSFVASGALVPYFEYNPDRSWSDLAKEFSDSVRYRYKVLNRIVYFQPIGDVALGVRYDETLGEKNFDPHGLTTNVFALPVVNDAIVIGDAEPQANRDDYFIGDGFTGNFPLRHQTFQGASSLLLEEDWTGTAFRTDLWTSVDPLGKFALVGALNVLGGDGGLSSTYILGKNGLELGGHLNLQHGEVFFTGTGSGILGGVYNNAALTAANCEAGFDIRPGVTVGVTASGASGLLIQPIRLGTLTGPQIVTRFNHHYFLQTLVSCRLWSRYNRTYRTLAGEVFGGAELTGKGDVTFIVQDIDLAQPSSPTVTRHSVTDIQLPAFALYAPVNSASLNCTLSFTAITRPPQAQLTVRSLYGPTGLQLPVKVPGVEEQYVVGSGFENQTATLGLSGDAQLLQFYTDTIPAVGARIRLRSWESGLSIGRVRDPASIASEAVIVGDDGVRSAVLTNLAPKPRTSEECELAAEAAIKDRVNTRYSGSYVFLDYFLTGAPPPGGLGTITDFPRSGRYLYVNTRQRGISGANFLVTSVRTKIVELRQEVILFQTSFGPDLFLDNMLRRFVNRTDNVLTPQEAAKSPAPQNLAAVGTTFLGDLVDTRLTEITGVQVTIDIGVTPVTGVEIRRADSGWGRTDQNLLFRGTNQIITLTRTALDETYFLRMVNGPKTSRFSKALRVAYPLVPGAPFLNSLDLTDSLHPTAVFDFVPDIRNIRGLEVRGTDNIAILPTTPRSVFSTSDLRFIFDNTIIKTRTIDWYAYFFNLLWDYSVATRVQAAIPIPDAPVITIGNVLALDVEIRLNRINRNDIAYTTVQMSTSSGFNVNMISVTGSGQPEIVSIHAPGASGQWVRARRTDFIGDGPFSVAVPVTSGALIRSSWLCGQGSIVPVTDDASAALFQYSSTTNQITWSGTQFSLKYPDGGSQPVPFFGPQTFSGLTPSTTYYFYPYTEGACGASPYVVMLGPYTAPNAAANAARLQDGRVPLSGGSITAATTAAGGGGGGGGGGGCVAEDMILTSIRGPVLARDATPGTVLYGSDPETQAPLWVVVRQVRRSDEQLICIDLQDGSQLRCSKTTPLPVRRDAHVETLQAVAVRLGDCLLTVQNGWVVITGLEDVDRGQHHPVVLLSCEPTHRYFANGVLTHNVLPRKD